MLGNTLCISSADANTVQHVEGYMWALGKNRKRDQAQALLQIK